MPALLQVMGLAAAAFLASALIGQDQRRAGAPSIYILVGVLIGPLGLGLLDEDTQPLLRPVLSLCVTWLGWLCGMRLCGSRALSGGWRAGLAAVLEGGAVVGAVMVGLHLVAPWIGASLPWAASAAIGVAVAASSPFAVEVFRGRLVEARPTFRFLEAVSSLDALVPLLGLLVLDVVLPAAPLADALRAPVWASAGAAVGLGLAGGLVFLLAVGRRASVDRGWVVLLGVLFLAAGVAGQIGLSELVVGAVAGAVMARSSAGRSMSDVVASTDRPVALLAAVIVGTWVGPDRVLLCLAALAAGLRVVGKLSAGPLLGKLGPRGRNLGLGLLSYGGFALAVAAQIQISYGGWLGALALTSAVGLCLVGDTLGAVGLLATLRSRGELQPAEVAGG